MTGNRFVNTNREWQIPLKVIAVALDVPLAEVRRWVGLGSRRLPKAAAANLEKVTIAQFMDAGWMKKR